MNLFIDHYIQRDILLHLVKHNASSFSDLKPEGVENSLFMYHMRKLIRRGIVDKTNQGYKLTKGGAQWINKMGQNIKLTEYPRLLVQFLCIDSGRLLVSERVDSLAEHLNRFILPGGLHQFGLSKQQAISRLSENFGVEVDNDNPLTTIEMISKAGDYHSIADVYSATFSGRSQSSDELYRVSFKKIVDIRDSDDVSAQLIVELADNHASRNLQSYIFKKL